MAFELKDFFRSYVKRGDQNGLFNVSREDSDDEGLKFYAFQNENGAYVIMRQTTSGTLKIYEYYAKQQIANFSDDWSGRTSLTYGEYYQLFPVIE